MHPLLLIGFDLVFSAILILAAMYVVWSRVRAHLESNGSGQLGPVDPKATKESEASGTSSLESRGSTSPFREMTKEAAKLRQKGCSTEEIAQQLQIPTREVETVLAISQMVREERSGQGISVSFPLEGGAVPFR